MTGYQTRRKIVIHCVGSAVTHEPTGVHVANHVRKSTLLSVVEHLFIPLHILPSFGHAANYEKQGSFIFARRSRASILVGTPIPLVCLS